MASNIENSMRIYIDPSDPLFLHPSDHPGMVLVSKPFNGMNFGAWRKSIAIALSAKNKLTFINGQVPKPSLEDPLFNIWQRCNDMVISWVLNALSPDIAESVLYSDTASQIWKELNDRYGQASGAKLYQLQKDISSIEQNNCDIAGYYTKFKRIWDEFSSLRSLPPCTCGCLQAMLKFEEDQKLIQFLMGLNSEYNTVRGNLLMMRPLPTVNQAYAILIQEEKQREVHASGRFVESAAFNVGGRHNFQTGFRPYFDAKNGSDGKPYPQYTTRQQTDGRNYAEGKKNIVCSHCKKPGHLASKCYRLVGFPRDFNFTKNRKFAACVQGSDQKNIAEIDENISEKGIDLTREEYNQIMRLLSKAQIHDQQSNNLAIHHPASSFAGPFNEGAIDPR